MRGQTVQRFNDCFVRQRQRFGHRLTFDQFRRHRTGCDGAAAAEGFKFHVYNGVVFDFQVDFHDVAALGVSDLTDAVGIFQDAYIAGITEMIHYFFTIKSHKVTSLNYKILFACFQIAPHGRDAPQIGHHVRNGIDHIVDFLLGGILGQGEPQGAVGDFVGPSDGQ